MIEEGKVDIFMVSRDPDPDAAASDASCVGEDLPDNEVDLLFSEFLRERMPLRALERGE